MNVGLDVDLEAGNQHSKAGLQAETSVAAATAALDVSREQRSAEAATQLHLILVDPQLGSVVDEMKQEWIAVALW